MRRTLHVPRGEVAADDISHQKRQQWLEHAHEQQKKAYEKRQQERLQLVLTIIRDNGGSISRKELTDILVKRGNMGRTTAHVFIKSNIGTKLNEVNGFIHAASGEELPY